MGTPHMTPFIPPLNTPSPDPVHPPVIPVSHTPSSHSSGSHTRSGSNVNTPAMSPTGAWNGTPYSAPGAPPPQYPFFGVGSSTPYGQTAFIPPYASPFGGSQPPPSAGPGLYTPLPPQGPGGLSLDYRGYQDLGPPTPLMGGQGAPPVTAPVIPPPPAGVPWHAGETTTPLHHTPAAGGLPPSTPWQGPPMGLPLGRGGGYGGGFGGGGFGAGGFGGGGFGGGPPYTAGVFPGAGWPGGGGGGFTPDPWGAGGGAGGAWGVGAAAGGGAWSGFGVQPGVQPSLGGAGAGDLPRRGERPPDRMPKWTAGPHYGPVLEPFQMKVVGAQMELNPLLTPVPDEGPEVEKVHLRWNMLMESSLVHRSCDPLSVSWAIGRNEPATFPRISELKIVSEHYPWLIEIKARDRDVGVTCGEVIDGIAANMYKLTSKADYDALSGGLKKVVLEAYRYNRSRNPNVPGGKMGEGMKRVDFLGQMTTFGGLEVDVRALERVCRVVMPGYVVLKCARRELLTEEEARAQQARARAASQAAGSSRAGSRAGSRTGTSSRGAGSVVGSTASGIGVDVEEPSDEEYTTSDED